jgi:hypothetical protein
MAESEDKLVLCKLCQDQRPGELGTYCDQCLDLKNLVLNQPELAVEVLRELPRLRMWVVVTGGIADGFQFHGPFPGTDDSAALYAEDRRFREWWAVQLEFEPLPEGGEK